MPASVDKPINVLIVRSFFPHDFLTGEAPDLVRAKVLGWFQSVLEQEAIRVIEEAERRGWIQDEQSTEKRSDSE